MTFGTLDEKLSDLVGFHADVERKTFEKIGHPLKPARNHTDEFLIRMQKRGYITVRDLFNALENAEIPVEEVNHFIKNMTYRTTPWIYQAIDIGYIQSGLASSEAIAIFEEENGFDYRETIQEWKEARELGSMIDKISPPKGIDAPNPEDKS